MSTPGPVAAIDCGTNTIKLLIGVLPDITVREMRMVRLGQGVDATGRLSEEALARTFAAIDEYAALIAAHGCTKIRFCATSASRDASNAADFVAGVRERLGVEPEVVSGAEEAGLAFDGALRNLHRSPVPPILVLDIGGGSTELVLGTTQPESSVSLNMGSVRMHERHLRSDPPTATEIAACAADIDACLDGVEVPIGTAATVVGVAGTTTTIAAGVLDLAGYDRSLTHQAILPMVAIHDVVDHVLALTVAERLELPWLHPGRADVIGAGALILSRVLRRTSATELVVSEADILDGIAWSMT